MSDKQSGAQALLAQMVGVSGLIYSSLPVLVFVPVSSLFGLTPAIIAALAVAALILVWRLIRRESTQPAISGFMGVGICALIAYLLGESKGYFLLGIWSSLFWAAVFALSVLIRRPVVGYIWSWVNGHDRAWRSVKAQGLESPPCTVTSDFAVTLKRPTAMGPELTLWAKAVDIQGDRATVEATLTAEGKVTATCRGTFVAVKPGHPAYHRW